MELKQLLGKLQTLNNILSLELNELNLDSTGSRYLIYVWYKTPEMSDYKNLNLIRLGSTSKNSILTLTFKDSLKIGKIVIKAAGWNGKTCKLNVNGGSDVSISSIPNTDIPDETKYGTYEFEFTETNVLVLTSTLSVSILEMEVYTVS